MGERELREKYGGKLPKAINRAIRAEIPGGNEALDKLTHLAGPALHSGWKDPKGLPTPEAAAYFKHQREVVERMEAEVRRKWGVPLDDGARKAASSRATRDTRFSGKAAGSRGARGSRGQREGVRRQPGKRSRKI
jgi:hypothetical protein